MKTKIVFFDMEGVIFETGIKDFGKNTTASIWTAVWNSLGEEAAKQEQKGKDMWNSGKFKNYIEWMQYSAHGHQKYKLTMKKFYEIIHSVPYIKGVKEIFEELRKKGCITAIITGGFKNQANKAIIDLKVDHTFAACEYFFDEQTDLLSHWNLLPCDYEGKAEFMKHLMRDYKFSRDQCAFIGDGVNDRFLAKEVGTSIAFNARKELQEVCTYSVNQTEGQKDLRAILEFLNI